MSSHSTLPRLPAELWDYIIDCLRDDRRALAVCSSTCRSWLPRARKHVFHVVILFHLPDFQRFQRLIHSSSTLAVYVRSLEIDETSRYSKYGRIDGRWSQILLKLDHLEHLTVRGCSNLPLAANFPIIRKPLSHLKSVRLYDVSWFKEHIVELLCSCPVLSAIYLDHVRCGWIDFGVPKPPVNITTTRIDTLSLVDTSEPIAAFIFKGPFILQLQRLQLTVPPYDVEKLRFLHAALRSVSASLTEFTIVVDEMSRYAPRLSERLLDASFSLVDTPQLSSLQFKSDCVVHADAQFVIDQSLFMGYLLHPIARTHLHLQEIRFSVIRPFNTGPVHFVSRDDPLPAWKALDEALALLARERLLLTVVFEFCYNPFRLYVDREDVSWHTEVVDYLLRCLPRLREERCRLGIVRGQKWADHVTFGGGIVGERHEQWFDCPS